jgi:hypothetical protein
MQASEQPIVFGAPYSAYVRAVRLVLEEKGVDYDLVPVDIFASGGPPPEHKARHPFGKIPVLREWWQRVSTRPSFLRTQVPPRHESQAVGAV